MLPLLNKKEERLKIHTFYNPFESGILTFHQNPAQRKILPIDHIKKLNLTSLFGQL